MDKVRSVSPAAVTAAVLAGVLMGFLGSSLLHAHNPNLPFPMTYIAPQLEHFPTSIEDSLAVEAHVDTMGRVQDYRVLSNAGKVKNLPMEVKNLLIFVTFRPATFMGRPASGTATLVFSHTGVSATPLSANRR